MRELKQKVARANESFIECGWVVNLEIPENVNIDDDDIGEDVAQFEKGDIIVDLGLHPSSLNHREYVLIIRVIKNLDWHNYIGELTITDVDLALFLMWKMSKFY